MLAEPIQSIQTALWEPATVRHNKHKHKANHTGKETVSTNRVTIKTMNSSTERHNKHTHKAKEN